MLFASAAHGSDSLRQHLLIRDFPGAIQEAKGLLSSSPEGCSLAQTRLALKALVQGKDYSSWFQNYVVSCQHYPQLAKDRDVLEDFAQQVLADGVSHSSLTVRAVSLLAIGMARDFRLVPLVLMGLNDDSVLVRTIALQVVLQYGTQNLKDAVCHIACRDESMQVRIMAYQIAAILGIEELLPYLKKCANNPLIDGYERREAWKASLWLCPELFSCSYTNKDMEQALSACEILRMGDEKSEEVLLSLLRIQYPEVQEAALRAALSCGREVSCESQQVQELVYHIATHSPFPRVNLQAAALLYLRGDPLGEKLLVEGLLSPYVSTCEAASVAVCSLGISGTELANAYIHKVSSRKAAANLAILLLVSRTNIETAGDVIADYMSDPEMCWAISQFLWDTDQRVTNVEMSLYFDLVKQEIGRKLIRLLTLAKYSKVKKVTEEFLANRQQHEWNFFSGLFWEESDDQNMKEETLEKGANFAAKLETTLATLYRKKTKEALDQAIALYPDSRWQDKLAILEGIAFSESTEGVSFLVDCCYRETPSLRSAAAGALFALFK